MGSTGASSTAGVERWRSASRAASGSISTRVPMRMTGIAPSLIRRSTLAMDTPAIAAKATRVTSTGDEMDFMVVPFTAGPRWGWGGNGR